VLEALRAAVDGDRQVEIDYYVYGRDERTRRVVDPWTVYAAEGEWYLGAWCHLALAERRFRIDRVRAVTILESPIDHRPEGAAPLGVFDPAPDDPRVVLELEPRARWVVEQYPAEAVEELGGGRCRVTLVVTEQPWLDRLLLRVGHDAKVVSGPGDVAAAARRVLARY
jgi:proteasome accessory factor C